MNPTIQEVLNEHRITHTGWCACRTWLIDRTSESHADHVAAKLSEAGFGSQHDAYEKGFAAGFDKAADDIGAWSIILDFEEDTSDNPYPPTNESETP